MKRRLGIAVALALAANVLLFAWLGRLTEAPVAAASEVVARRAPPAFPLRARSETAVEHVPPATAATAPQSDASGDVPAISTAIAAPPLDVAALDLPAVPSLPAPALRLPSPDLAALATPTAVAPRSAPEIERGPGEGARPSPPSRDATATPRDRPSASASAPRVADDDAAGTAPGDGLGREPARPHPRNPLPRYPDALRRGGAIAPSGTVTVAMTVGEDGRPRAIAIVAREGPEAFAEAVIDAVSRWRFEPASREGRPIAVRVRKTFRFRPDSAR